LEVGGIKDCFTASSVFTREQVSRGKPAPDLFLFAAEKMNVKPEKCLVVEDSVAGIEAAKAAGMPCVGYLGGGHALSSWYRKAVTSYDIPIAYSEEEVYDLVSRVSVTL
jgi:beta-phosphoglucomutase-like phosphatase (HAD superfamily)